MERFEGKSIPHPKAKDNADQFRPFDIVVDCTDHHFHGANKELALSQVKRGWTKKVQQERSIFEKDLPEQIYVRAFEERMDLLRAAMVGAPGTPYHDGLFFFDIYLPPEYPHEPPMVHYSSGGLRVNPNLYESEKVCLSLLNPWTGTVPNVPIDLECAPEKRSIDRIHVTSFHERIDYSSVTEKYTMKFSWRQGQPVKSTNSESVQIPCVLA